MLNSGNFSGRTMESALTAYQIQFVFLALSGRGGIAVRAHVFCAEGLRLSLNRGLD